MIQISDVTHEEKKKMKTNNFSSMTVESEVYINRRIHTHTPTDNGQT